MCAKTDLADERYCDDCPCLHWHRAGSGTAQYPGCDLVGVAWRSTLTERPGAERVLRPQTCIEADKVARAITSELDGSDIEGGE